MKTIRAFLILTGLLFCLYACKKDSNTNPGSIIGKWNVVSIETSGVSHAGQPGDYYQFTANGALYIKGGNSTATLNYTIADSTITLTFPSIPDALAEWGRITTFTAHSLVINGPYPVSPGGPITEGSSISLSR
jgi:hypothetical protein